MGGPQTRPFLLYPAALPAPARPIVGAASVHDLLWAWRRFLESGHAPPAAEPPLQAGARAV
ncbi:MAG TPA: hypothetical protein VLW53_11390, partial [Candidatus Eisenbacteria bacterium]|nr:hypothetical protein [Candidatus Eisenbacteria bacterium]